VITSDEFFVYQKNWKLNRDTISNPYVVI